jgi:hypothetical protein
MSPTDYDDNAGDDAIINKKGHGLGVFFNVLVLSLLVLSLFFAIYLGIKMFQVRKQRAGSPSDLEMKKMQDESEEAEVV